MSDNQIPVIKFLFREQLNVLNDALAITPGFEIKEQSDAQELSSTLIAIQGALVMASIRDKKDLIQLANLVKISKTSAKETALKIVVFQFFKDKAIEKAIAKLGILDLVDPLIQTKALKFKIDFWMKSLKGQIKNAPKNDSQKVKTSEQKTEKKSNENFSQPVWLEPLELEDDIWILKNESDCKKVLSKWLIRLCGPGQTIATWVEDGPGLWRFDFKLGEKELFIGYSGSWYFSGDQKPEFIWKENIWLITGDVFELYFKNGDKIDSRFKCKDKVLKIAKNSLYAKTKQEAINESFDKEMVFKKEASQLNDLSGKNSTDNLGGPLKGNNSTDNLSNGPLKGNSGTHADQFGNLSGNTYGTDDLSKDNLEMSSTSHQDAPNLERDEKNNKHKKHYYGHNAAETFEAGNLSAKMKAEKPSDNLSGENSTDQIETHYQSNSESSKKDANNKAPKENRPRKPAVRAKAFSGPINYDMPDERPADNVLDFSSDKTEQEYLDEQTLEEITQDAQVNAFLFYEDSKIQCAMDDFFDDTVFFKMDHVREINPQTNIQAQLTYLTAGKAINLDLDGNVLAVESDGDGKLFLTMQVGLQHIKLLEGFLKEFQNRQQNVDAFMKLAKGL